MFLEHTVGVRFAEFKSEGSKSLPCTKCKSREKALTFSCFENTVLLFWVK